ncbi:hypothetical protein HYH02_001789 [Chlamydomonas schloesseri]|uniref:Uncharacterized protein n=1 Tax=Chlamydomonas schloesseri TaxID=2026947 RepID=A0A835WW79_9CHLO|nr:hypothetical protein HYH02_001789 [Chlamydomonas schloesseri]|eukprot:KAG2453570.1 hypothetical protein HYH02_001789 [Chlamydomonas schloesseri]
MTTQSLYPWPCPLVGVYPTAATAASLYPGVFVTVTTTRSAKPQSGKKQSHRSGEPDAMKQQIPKVETQPEAKAGVQKCEAAETEPETTTDAAKAPARQQRQATEKAVRKPGALKLVKARAAAVCTGLWACMVEGAEAACALENGRCHCTCGQCVTCVYKHNRQGYVHGC